MYRRSSPGRNSPDHTSQSNPLRPPAGSSRRLFQPVRGQLSSAAVRDVCKASRACNCEGYCADGGFFWRTRMSFGLCNKCIFCRNEDFRTLAEVLKETEYVEGQWMCCRHAPSNYRTLRLAEDNETLTQATFPKLDRTAAVIGECGCGEFAIAKK